MLGGFSIYVVFLFSCQRSSSSLVEEMMTLKRKASVGYETFHTEESIILSGGHKNGEEEEKEKEGEGPSWHKNNIL